MTQSIFDRPVDRDVCREACRVGGGIGGRSVVQRLAGVAIATAAAAASLFAAPTGLSAAPRPTANAASPGQEAARPTPAPTVSHQPRLLGSQPAAGGEMLGNSVGLLFADLDPGNGTPTAEVVDQASRAQIANKTSLSCRGTGSARRCLLLVTLLSTEVGHRYRVTALGATVEVRAAAGHPGDRRR